MATPFDFNVTGRNDASAPSVSSPQSQGRAETVTSPSHYPGNVTVYQTTGPDAHTGPVMAPGGSGMPLLNPRSCVTCRRRKVRCDKQMPCSNCRRALIPCVFPAPGRAPRQHRPKDPNVPPKNTSQREVELVKRLKKLEGIVEELSGQIEFDAGGRFPPSVSGSPDVAHHTSSGSSTTQRYVSSNLDALATSCSSPMDNDSITEGAEGKRKESQKPLGRMVLDDSKGTSRYVSSGFWSKLNDELDAIREETQKLTDDDADDSDYEASPTDSPTTVVGSVYGHHAFILGYRSVDVNLHSCHPLPSHGTFLWSAYQANVDPLIKILHTPSVELILNDARRGPERLTPNNEALLFSIYFGAITSLEPHEVQTNFGTSKDELLSQYRFAVEQSLAKANFLNTSDITVLQAFTIFLLVARRHDESRFCWSLTSLLIRIAQGMGIHRDGTNFGLAPFDTEMRRRLWWAILTLDLRSAEELGTDMAVGERGYDTCMPTNINDADISPTSTEYPEAREGRSECAVSLVRYEICALSRRLLSASSAMASLGSMVDESTVAEKERMLIDVYQRVEHKLLQHVEETDPLYWVAAMISRVIMAKMCLVIYQPMLFPGSDHELSEEIRQRIYIAAIEIIEYNHRLNTDSRCKQYRWLFKTYTNWHAIAYTLIETCRRPWTALVERGWEAVNGYNRDPVEIAKRVDHAAVFLPLRKLFIRARRHRESELARLRANPDEARQLDFTERMNPPQARFGPVPGAENRMEQVREKWQTLILPDSATPMPPFLARLQTPMNPLPPNELLSSRPTSRFQQPQQAPPSNRNDNSMKVGLSDATMEYMDDLMAQPQIGISMAELWAVDQLEMSTAVNGKAPDTASTDDSRPATHLNQLAGNDAMRQQAILLQTQLPRDDHQPPYLWSDPFISMNTKFEDKPGEDMDMIGDDFNWQDWSQSIRGLEIDGSQPRKGW